MDTTSIFKFATLRNASDKITTQADLIVNPKSLLVTDLININESENVNNVKLADFNTRLQNYINSPSFIKTKKAFNEALGYTGSVGFYNQLYDNIVARTITKSNTNQIYKLLIEQLKTEHMLANTTTFPNMPREKIK